MAGDVLVTGSTGFLGGHLMRHLSPKMTVRGFKGLVNDDLDRICEECEGIDTIVHLAAIYDTSEHNAQYSLMVNGMGTVQMLEAAKRSGVKRFIYISTVHVYSPLEGTISEATVPRPVHPYAITHKTAEDFVRAAHAKKELTGIVLRLSNSFGVPTTESKNAWMPIVNSMCRQAVENGFITLHPSAIEMRDFIMVGDVCRAIEHFIHLPHGNCLDGLFNIGGNNEIRICMMADVVKLEAQYQNIDVKITHPAQYNEITSFYYDISKAKRSGFTPGNGMAEEIRSLLVYCREHYGRKGQ